MIIARASLLPTWPGTNSVSISLSKSTFPRATCEEGDGQEAICEKENEQMLEVVFKIALK